jgi:hypothetical protein
MGTICDRKDFQRVPEKADQGIPRLFAGEHTIRFGFELQNVNIKIIFAMLCT